MFCVQGIQKVKEIAFIVVASRVIVAWSVGTLKLRDLNNALLKSSEWHLNFHICYIYHPPKDWQSIQSKLNKFSSCTPAPTNARNLALLTQCVNHACMSRFHKTSFLVFE